MYRDKSIAVVVPAFCEEALIAQTVQGIPDFVDHIFVVDDASPDHTSEVVSGIAHPRVMLVRHDINKGVGGSILTGHRMAIQEGCDISVVMAGDDQMDPSYLPALLDTLIDEHADYAKGNRFFSRRSVHGMPAYRVVGNMILTFLTKAASGYWHIVDPQNGYTAITTTALRELPLDRISPRYEFENDMLIWLNINEARVIDVPIPARYGTETSTVRLGSFVARTLRLLSMGFWRRMWYRYMLWNFSPVAVFLLSGLTLLALAIPMGIWTIAQAAAGHTPTAGTTMLSVVPFLMAFVLLVNAVVLDIQNTPK